MKGFQGFFNNFLIFSLSSGKTYDTNYIGSILSANFVRFITPLEIFFIIEHSELAPFRGNYVYGSQTAYPNPQDIKDIDVFLVFNALLTLGISRDTGLTPVCFAIDGIR
jgi:hypothetical protein